jgi:hypothetical protein
MAKAAAARGARGAEPDGASKLDIAELRRFAEEMKEQGILVHGELRAELATQQLKIEALARQIEAVQRENAALKEHTRQRDGSSQPTGSAPRRASPSYQQVSDTELLKREKNRSALVAHLPTAEELCDDTIAAIKETSNSTVTEHTEIKTRRKGLLVKLTYSSPEAANAAFTWAQRKQLRMERQISIEPSLTPMQLTYQHQVIAPLNKLLKESGHVSKFPPYIYTGIDFRARTPVRRAV